MRRHYPHHPSAPSLRVASDWRVVLARGLPLSGTGCRVAEGFARASFWVRFPYAHDDSTLCRCHGGSPFSVLRRHDTPNAQAAPSGPSACIAWKMSVPSESRLSRIFPPKQMSHGAPSWLPAIPLPLTELVCIKGSCVAIVELLGGLRGFASSNFIRPFGTISRKMGSESACLSRIFAHLSSPTCALSSFGFVSPGEAPQMELAAL